MRYNVGDRVLVRDDLQSGEYYYNDETDDGMDATEEMANLAGTVVTISEIAHNWSDRAYYHVEELGDRLFWSDGMFIGLAEDDNLSQSPMNIKQFFG